jgi:hypothetical protein
MCQARRKNQRAIRSEGHCFVLDPEDVDDLLALMVRRSGTELLEIKIADTDRGRAVAAPGASVCFHASIAWVPSDFLAIV